MDYVTTRVIKDSQGEHMATPSLNWSTLKREFSKIGSVDDVKVEFQKLVKEVNKLDLNSYLSPQAKKRLTVLEGRYQKFMTSVNRTQRDFDREFERLLRLLKQRRSKVETAFGAYKTKAKKQHKSAKKKVAKKSSAGKKTVKKKARR
jgi:hypothetical protein